LTPASPPSASTPARGSGDLRASISTRRGAPLARRFFVFLGPGYLVATGYMDPGNWATALAAGSRYGYELLFAAVLSSLMAIVLQALSARLGLASGLDLAQTCRACFSKPAAIALWLVAEAAIAATDLAEIIGTAIGLQLLFGMPLAVGIAVTLLDTFVVLAFERAGFRKIELFVVSLLGLIAFSFTAQLAMAHVDFGQVARGLVPTRRLLDDPRMLYLGLGIVGATVMPHNLFLHSSIVLTRAVGASPAEKREAIGFALIDSAIALFFALLVNGAILVLAASVFYASGHVEVTELAEAHRLIAPLLGAPLAAKLFAIALIACGLNSTVTATLSGQIVMEGFVRLRMTPTRRRLFTRLIAVVPTVAVTLISGEAATGGLLIASQVVLSFTLPFAMVPLIWFTASRRVMGELIAPRHTTALAAIIAVVIIALNAKLIIDALAG
jgi:manganese transport protein